jgi:effector-binding domain-containing protein
MLGEPRVEQRDAQAYVAIRSTVPRRDLPTAIPRDIGAVMAWLGSNGVAMGGAPFVRYRVVDMGRDLDIEVGVRVEREAGGGDGVDAGVLPAGRYATVVHTGPYDGLVEAHAALQAWAVEQGLELRRGEAGFEVQLESYLTDPAEEPDLAKHETEVAYLLAA